MNTSLYLHPRAMAEKVPELSGCFPCVLITGAGQVGKSTLLKSIMPADMEYITPDDHRLEEIAKSDPIGQGNYAFPISAL